MKSEQALKETAYRQSVSDLAKPFSDSLIARVEQELRRVFEDPRPTTQAGESILVEGIHLLDILAVVGRVEEVVRDRFHARGFAVSFVHRNGQPMSRVEALLTW